MAGTTGRVKFNVKDRGRRFRGMERNFDTAALATLINSGDVQERVAHGDMHGYFGHWPRVKFGLSVTEGGIVGGQAIHLEPAIRTIYLKALPDGTIEHETEFLDTAPGKLAKRLYDSKAGGFSSAIGARRCGPNQMPIGFHGFDYVLEPNYTKNRGYVLDGVEDADTVAMFDEANDYIGMLDAVNELYDSLQSAYDSQSAALERANLEVIELTSMLARATREPVIVNLDGIAAESFGGGESRIEKTAEMFMSAPLVGYQKPAQSAADQAKEAVVGAAKKMLGRMFS